MFESKTRKTAICCLLLLSSHASAEGIIDINPSIATSITHDDNVFRFSSPDEAKAVFGSSATSDTIRRLDLGVGVNLRLSRQLLTLSANVNESRYNRFDVLDNTGNSYNLGWNWRLGNDFYGVLSTSKIKAIAGFNEIRSPIRNTRTFKRQLANIHWNYHPDWVWYAAGETVEVENELDSFIALDRKDEIFETGLRFQNTLATQLGVSYRVNQSDYPNRTGFAQFFFGDESKQEIISLTGAWLPTHKTRLSVRLSQVLIEYKNNPQRDFDGFSQRWDINHAMSGKLTLNAAAYREVAPFDDIESTYVQATGFNISPIWNITSKVSLRAGLGYEERDYLGSAGFFTASNNDRGDESTTANLALNYTPTLKSLVQLQYLGEKRVSSINNQSFEFNTINFSFRYDY